MVRRMGKEQIHLIGRASLRSSVLPAAGMSFLCSFSHKRLEDIVFNLKAGNPIVFGTVIGKDWFEYKGKEPLEIEKRPECCHAMCVVGYIDGNFVIENSWGNWGLNGFCFVKPEVMASDNTKDLWVIVDGSENWVEK